MKSIHIERKLALWLDEHQLSTSINIFDFFWWWEESVWETNAPSEMSDDSQHLSENMTEEAFQLRTLRGMIYRKIKQKKVNTEVQKDVKSTSLKCMILWKPLDIFSMITSWKPRTEDVSDYCDFERIQFRQVENTSELSVTKTKVTILWWRNRKKDYLKLK